jgi:preprotein translocase subunit SecA
MMLGKSSKVISRLLQESKIPHNLLNARPENVEWESEIVAQAGRGTDIILGGNAEYMARLKVREYFVPKIVRPEDDHFTSAGQGFGGREKPQSFGNGAKGKGKSW